MLSPLQVCLQLDLPQPTMPMCPCHKRLALWLLMEVTPPTSKPRSSCRPPPSTAHQTSLPHPHPGKLTSPRAASFPQSCFLSYIFNASILDLAPISPMTSFPLFSFCPSASCEKKFPFFSAYAASQYLFHQKHQWAHSLLSYHFLLQVQHAPIIYLS